MLIGVLIFWILCGVVAYGGTLAYFQKKFNVYNIAYESRRYDIAFASFVGLTGPIGLCSIVVLSDFFKYGFMFKPLTKEESNPYGDAHNQFEV